MDMGQLPEVLIDANFALIPVQFKLDIYSELDRIVQRKYQIVTLEPITEEIQKIAKGKLALQMLENKGVRIIPTSIRDVDDAIVDYAERENAIVCTNDKELENRLREKGITVIYMRGKNRLDAKGNI